MPVLKGHSPTPKCGKMIIFLGTPKCPDTIISMRKDNVLNLCVLSYIWWNSTQCRDIIVRHISFYRRLKTFQSTLVITWILKQNFLCSCHTLSYTYLDISEKGSCCTFNPLQNFSFITLTHTKCTYIVECTYWGSTFRSLRLWTVGFC